MLCKWCPAYRWRESALGSSIYGTYGTARTSRVDAKELSFNKFPISVHPEKGRATELRQAQSERSQAMKIGKLFPDNS